MDEIEIRVDGDSIRIWMDQIFGFPDITSHAGGYDVRGGVEIWCGHYHAHGALEFSTGEVWQFYTELMKAYKDLAGSATFRSTEGNLEFTVTFGGLGHFVLEGAYQERQGEGTKLMFMMKGDQTYLRYVLSQLAQFVATFGDNRGFHAGRDQEELPQRSKWPPYH